MTSKFVSILAKYVLPFLLQTEVFNPQVQTNFKNSYDYIVVGAGSAGAVIASRLSEDPCVSVLLLDAGPEAQALTEVPGASFFTFDTVNDWQYKTLPQSRGGLGRKNNEFHMPAGKGLGGSSLLFSPQYFRGNKRDYDRWAQNGAEGWSYDEVLPYFIKSENNTDPRINGNGYHGTNGYLTIQDLQYKSQIYDTFNRAGQEIGLKFRDTNGPKVTGVSLTQGQTRFGRRCSAAKAFLVPAQNRPNLDIVINAHVYKVLINENKQAYGVKFDINGQDHEVRANLEVILAAGAYNTPQILMLSGIGPQDHLTKLGIPVIEDLPVGDNFQTHAGTIGPSIVTSDAINSNFFNRVYQDPQGVSNEFNQHGTGILTAINGFEGHAFFNSKDNDPALDWPDLHYILVDYSDRDLLYEFPASEFGGGYNDLSKYNGKNTFVFLTAHFRPASRGYVRLASNNYKDKPIIEPNLFQQPDDMEKVIEATQAAVDLVTKTNAFKSIGAELFDVKFPGCEQYVANSTYWSPEYVRCLSIRHTFLYFHQVGTCKMGGATDKTAVVDPQLKVKGIKNLRVADASIIPTLPSAAPNPAVMMIGEKAADLIKQDNPNRLKC